MNFSAKDLTIGDILAYYGEGEEEGSLAVLIVTDIQGKIVTYLEATNNVVRGNPPVQNSNGFSGYKIIGNIRDPKIDWSKFK